MNPTIGCLKRHDIMPDNAHSAADLNVEVVAVGSSIECRS